MGELPEGVRKVAIRLLKDYSFQPGYSNKKEWIEKLISEGFETADVNFGYDFVINETKYRLTKQTLKNIEEKPEKNLSINFEKAVKNTGKGILGGILAFVVGPLLYIVLCCIIMVVIFFIFGL